MVTRHPPPDLEDLLRRGQARLGGVSGPDGRDFPHWDLVLVFCSGLLMGFTIGILW